MWSTIIQNIFKRKEAVRIDYEDERARAAIIAGDGRGGLKKIFNRSVRIRQVDAGSCNACEWECTALGNPVYDVSRYGIDFVASPRHADILLVTGPVSKSMVLALKQTYRATPDPRIVIGCGDCTVDGGIFRGSYAVTDGLGAIIPVAGFIAGCPPSPDEIARGIRRIVQSLITDKRKTGFGRQ
jgi:Ni,Fe-hydrogenase III small subunit